MATIATNLLRTGSVFEFENKKYSVIKYQHIKKGRGQATIRLKVRNLESQVITEMTFSNEQSVLEADVVKKSAQFLYSDIEKAYFMDSDDFSQFELLIEDIGDKIKYLKDGSKVITLFLDGKPVSIEIQKTTELKVVETEPAIAGNTATGAMKNAILETGLEIKVPLFIKIGDIIKINTDTSTYQARVN